MINQRDYKFYVVRHYYAGDIEIVGGWEYKEDADDFMEDNKYMDSHPEYQLKLYAKRYLTMKGIDVNDDRLWQIDE